MTITLNVNGKSHQVDAEADTPLLYVLRNDLELHAAKYGCGLGQCGACTVMIDGKAALSCVTPLLVAQGREITTVEGLGTAENPGPIQAAFIEKQSAQCGYCIAGMMMSAAAPSEEQPEAERRRYPLSTSHQSLSLRHPHANHGRDQARQ